MFGSEVLEVGIGMALVFLFASLIATALRELIEAALKTRGADLERGILEMLPSPPSPGEGGPSLVRDFYKHPLISSLFGGTYKSSLAAHPSWFSRLVGVAGGNLPSYIPAANFSAALLDMVARGRDASSAAAATASGGWSLDGLRANVSTIENVTVQRAILSAIDTAGGDIDLVRRNLESWYDGTMDRVSGWYKRRTQFLVFWIGLVTAVGLNIDAVQVYRELIASKTLRAIVVEQAKTAAGPADARPPRSIDELSAELSRIGYPVGWPAPQLHTCKLSGATASCTDWSFLWLLASIPGWLITAVAVTLGAPFWFDVLNKFMVIRSTVKPYEKSPSEDSEDRQRAVAAPDRRGDADRAATKPG